MAGTTYTFSTKTAPVEPGQEDNFGNLAVDASHEALTGVTGAGPQTVDISVSPLVSPITVSNSSPTTMNIPLNAAQVVFLATTNTVNISESVSAVSSNYFTIPTGTQVTVDVTRCSKLYLQANTGSATVSFYFNVV